MKKETRGGARPNAGRKRQGEEAKRTTVSFVCTPSEKEKLKELASLSGLSQSQFICKKLFSFDETATKEELLEQIQKMKCCGNCKYYKEVVTVNEEVGNDCGNFFNGCNNNPLTPYWRWELKD